MPCLLSDNIMLTSGVAADSFAEPSAELKMSAEICRD
jgi:hypothetical protein